MLKVLTGKVLFAALCLMASSSAFAYGGFAAIVFNPATGSYGAYHGANDRQDAELDAMSYCGGNCSIDLGSLESMQASVRETWAYNGWVALAKGDNNVYATAGIHDSEYDAEQSALNNCYARTNNCYIVRSMASYVNFPDVDGVKNN
jgi:hypothetical protein